MLWPYKQRLVNKACHAGNPSFQTRWSRWPIDTNAGSFLSSSRNLVSNISTDMLPPKLKLSDRFYFECIPIFLRSFDSQLWFCNSHSQISITCQPIFLSAAFDRLSRSTFLEILVTQYSILVFGRRLPLLQECPCQ